jgi:hypothetical protein
MSMGAVCFDGRRPLMPQSITAVSDCLHELPQKRTEKWIPRCWIPIQKAVFVGVFAVIKKTRLNRWSPSQQNSPCMTTKIATRFVGVFDRQLEENTSIGAVCFDGRRPLMPQSITAVSDWLHELPRNL